MTRLATRHLLWMLLLSSLASAVFASASLETRIKAAFLYKFCSYIEWPVEAFTDVASPIVIGVVAAEPMAQELRQATAGRRVNGRPLEIRTLTRLPLPDDLQLLFIGHDAYQPEAFIDAVRGKPVLIVTDTPDAIGFGSSINFTLDDGRVRFDISLPSAQAQHLRISSKLLGVARQVQEAMP